MEHKYTFTRNILNRVNQDLKHKCSVPLSVQLYEYNNINNSNNNISLYDEHATFDFLLCLNIIININKTIHKKKEQCISSLSCKIAENGELEFSSKTHPDFEGKKYNLLLRSILILLSSHIRTPPLRNETVGIVEAKSQHRQINQITQITQIVSKAINPISIYLMVKYFHAFNEQLETFMNQQDITFDTFTFDDAETFYTEKDFLDMDENMDMDMDEEEMNKQINKQMKNNENFGSPVILTLNPHNNKVIQQASFVYHQVLHTLKCPTSPTSSIRPTSVKKGGYKKSKKTKSKKPKKNKKKTKKGKKY